MKYLLPLVTLCFSVLGCYTAPTESEAAGSSDDDIVQSEPFQAWLEAQCPDDASVQRTDASGSVTIPCKDARAMLLEEPSARDEVLRVYRGSVLGLVTEDGERIGETSQSWSPLGLACGLVAAGTTLAFNWPNRFGGKDHGCKDHRIGPKMQDDCEAITTGGGFVAGILCAFL